MKNPGLSKPGKVGDMTNQIRQTNIDIQRMIIKVNKVSNITDSNFHREINEVKIPAMELELFPDLPIYVKIKVSGKDSPCTINFKYKTLGHMQVFYSLRNKLPDEKDFLSQHPHKIVIKPEKKKSTCFKQEYLYLKMYSLKGI